MRLNLKIFYLCSVSYTLIKTINTSPDWCFNPSKFSSFTRVSLALGAGAAAFSRRHLSRPSFEIMIVIIIGVYSYKVDGEKETKS